MPLLDNIAGAGAAKPPVETSAPGGDEKDVDPPSAQDLPLFEVHFHLF